MLSPMDAAEPLPTRRFTVEEVLRMVELGILDEDEPIELLDGELVVVTPQGPRHGTTSGALRDRLIALYAGRACVREDKPLVASRHSLPEPDIAVCRGRHADYRHRHPAGADTILVVELAVTSQQVDRRKLALYARAAVPVVWLADLVRGRLDVYTGPQPDGSYASVATLGLDDVVTPPETTEAILVSDLIG